MTKPYVTHAVSKFPGKGRCGSFASKFSNEPTCQRCLSILSGERRVGTGETQHQRIVRFEEERRVFGSTFCACNGEHPEVENHGPIRCW